jgi:tellurite methyltransferase
MLKKSSYDKKYTGENFYWGKEPSSMAPRVLELVKPSVDFHPRLLDIGCGEGRDVVYFAQHGFEATGLDLSLPGLEKAQRYAQEVGASIKTIHADVLDYALEATYDVIFSTGTLHYLPQETRAQRFEDYKAHTSPTGIHVVSAFVDKPFLPPAPDSDTSEYAFQSGELLSYYWDWEIPWCVEEIFDCNSGGVPHKHCICRLVARRYQG